MVRPLPFAQAFASALVLALCVGGCAACKADGDGNAVDASTIDAADASGPLTFETQLSNLADGTSLFDVTVTEVGTQNSAQSAPNGRAILVLGGQGARVSHELAGFLTNTTQVDDVVLQAHNDQSQPLQSDLISVADLDTLYSGLGIAVDDQTTQLFLYVRADDFSAAAGVDVTVAGAGQSYVRNLGGDFEAGTSPIADPLLIVPNVVGAQASVTFSATCPGAATIDLQATAIASAFFRCDPSL